ncbi:bifunctional cobalt-precorrin-7 (C(5))-methyltransferase/cobalt-precorrin-6B (C(15))-methyltransferase, partial [Aduncisulcus paluster]
MQQEDKKVVLLADGDPLLFGIAASLIPLLGEENVAVSPAVSAVQIGSARLAHSWKDFEIISLHGRNDYSPLFGAMQRNKDCALETPDEQVVQGEPESFLNFTCPDLNIVILTAKNKKQSTPLFGRDDNSFTREKGLITKLPVRSAGIALLGLSEGQTVWDLGAGCGSVAIESSFIAAG